MFTPEIWFRLVERYQLELWPLQLVTLSLGGWMLWQVYYRPANSSRAINMVLSVCWAWVGWVFHFNYFATINFAALGFGGLFLLQAVMLLYFGVFKQKPQFQHRKMFNLGNRFGVFLVVFSLLALPILAAVIAGKMAQADVFGLSPDATALATIGFILMAKRGGRKRLLLLPMIWAIVSALQMWTISGVGYG